MPLAPRIRPEWAIRLRRVYGPRADDDGVRVLVTRYWPRGVKRDAVDEWLKDLGTPPDMLKRYQQGRLSYEEFAGRYRTWLGCAPEAATALARLLDLVLEQPVTLLTSFSDLARSHVPALRAALVGQAVERLAHQALQATRRFSAICVQGRGGHRVGVGAADDGALGVIAAAVAESGQPLTVTDTESQGRSPQCYAGSTSLLALPIAHRGGLVGAVVAASEQIGAFSEAEQAPLIHLASQAGAFLVDL